MKKYLLSTLIFSLSFFGLFAQNYHVNEDFNAGTLPAGWNNTAVTGTHTWEFGIDGSGGTSTNISAGIQNFDGTKFAYFDDDSLSGTSTNDFARLTTPSFDNSTNLVTTLEFDYNFKQYPGIPDSFYVEVFDGANWLKVLTRTTDDCGHYSQSVFCGGGLPHANIDISNFNNPNCQVRFTFFDGGDWAWYAGVDNVQIYSPFPNDVMVSEIVSPTSGCNLSTTESIEVKIKNVGTLPASNFTVSYLVNGGTVNTETINNTIAPEDSLNYTFTATSDLSAVSTYSIKSYTNLSGDGNLVNDSTTEAIINEQIFTPTYTNDFETSNTGWKISGTNSSWELGVPNNNAISSAASGQQAYVTNLNGIYNSNETSYLTSPCMDFSASIGDPIVTFSLQYLTEAGFDQFWMEYSFDRGQSWTKLPAGGNPTNWYNNTSAQVWEGLSNGWKSVENVLVGFAGQPNVQLRLAFDTDGGGFNEGIGFDQFAVRDPQPIDMSLNQLLYPSTSSAPFCGYSANENVIVELENKGANTINSYDVSYQIGSSPVVTETVNIAMPPNSQLTYNFNTKANFSTITTYNVRVWVSTTGDTFSPNDTVDNLTITNTQNNPAVPIRYFESFDSFTAGSGFSNPGSVLRNGWTNSGLPDWRVAFDDSNLSTNTGACQDHTTGNGNYVYLETSTGGSGDEGLLVSPCIDLSANQGARLNFWYFMFGGDIGTLFVDIDGGNGWQQIDQISGQQQTACTNDWLLRDISISQFAGRRIRIRFRGLSQGCCSGDIAIDDVEIFEPLPRDANLLGPVAPSAGCEVSDQSIIEVEVRNDGTQQILPDSMLMYYQVDGLPPVQETFQQILAPEQTTTFAFAQPADFSSIGRKYNIKTWVKLFRDQNDDNDTIFKYRVTNHTKIPNYAEDFESFRDAKCDAYIGQVVQRGWVADPNPYAWHVQKSQCGKDDLTTPDPNTGPGGDHTSGNGIFMYTANTAATNGPGNAFFTSPCLDLTAIPQAKLSYWYHKYGSTMGNLSVQVATGTGWQTLQSISGQTQNSANAPWLNAVVDLSSYVGGLTQIRFVGTNSGVRGNMAIDDLFLYQPIDQDIGVVKITNPSGDNCNLSTAAQVTIEVENFGNQVVAANTAEVRYTNNGGQLAIDTITQSIPVGGTVTHTFSATVDLNGSGEQLIKASTRLTGDTIFRNNALTRSVFNRKVGFPFYFQDFERFKIGANGYPGDDLKGWQRSPNGNGHTWHAWTGDGPTIDGIPPAQIPPNGPKGGHTFATDRKNGDGTYMLSETSFGSARPDATFSTPCGPIDFTQSKNGKVLLSFWYHMHGANTGDLYVDVFSGNQWQQGIGVINGQQQGSGTEPWRFAQVSLDNFTTGTTNGRIRFRSDMLPGIGGGDIGIDDVSLLDRDSVDVTVLELLEPTSDCDKSNREKLEVEVQNTGTEDIIELKMAYQVTFYPLNGAPVTSPVVRDEEVGALILPLGKYTFEFDDPNSLLDMTESGKYEIKIWSEDPQDGYRFNDTIVDVVENTTRPFPSCEDFSGLLYEQKAPDFQDELLPNNWVGSSSSSYAWTASIRGPGGTGGPFEGHTSGPNDIYMLLEPAMGPPTLESWIYSPCFDLTSTRAANLEFWYIAPSENHFLLVEARAVGGGGWQNIDTIQGFGFEQVNNWTRVEFVLADFLGNFVEFRLRGFNTGGLYAIDDLCVIQPPPQQIELEQIFRPQQGLCYYSDQEEMVLRVQNVGVDRIDSFQVVLQVDVDNPKSPRGQYQNDTMMIYPNNPTLEPGDKMDIPLDSTVDMSGYRSYFVSATINLDGDLDPSNNVVYDYPYTHNDPIDLPYLVDFEDPNDPYEGMTGFNGPVNPNTGLAYEQDVVSGLVQDYFNKTGPDNDHTFQNNNGHYWTTLSAGGAAGDAVALFTQCIDFQNSTNPKLSYWYHRHSQFNTMGDFYVEANDDFGWVRIDSLKGADPDQDRHSSAWKKVTVNLDQYAGDVVKFRFISIQPGGSSGFEYANHALDDINFFDQAPKDVAAHELIRPSDYIYSCYTDTQSVKVGVRNNGSNPLDFSTDTLRITVHIEKDGIPWDTLYRTVDSDVWRDPDNSFVLDSLPSDTVATIEMDSTFDMSDIGSSFDFEIILSMQSDGVPVNDTLNQTVLAQRERGNISSIVPNTTVCYGTPVQLTLSNFFGALTWQERQLDENGNGFWLDGLSFQTDPSVYQVLLDTSTEFRVLVCREEESDTVKVDVTRPFPGSAIHNSLCYSDYDLNDEIEVGVVVPQNIDEVRFFADADTSQQLKTSEIEDVVLPSGRRVFNYLHTFDRGPSSTFDLSKYNTDTIYVHTRIDSCWSPFQTQVYASVNPLPKNFITGIPANDTLCQDTSVRLNAGGYPDRKYTYDWTITKPGGVIEKDSVQTIVVDAWKLQKDEVYTYSVVVTTDSGCVLPSPVTTSITIVDSCVTRLEDYKFGDEFSIYPNPTSNDLYVEYRSLEALNGNVKLLSMEGKVIFEEVQVDFTKTRTKFDMATLPKGIYFIRIETNQGIITKKIVKS